MTAEAAPPGPGIPAKYSDAHSGDDTSPGGGLGGIDHGKSRARALKNSIATVLIWGAFFIALIPLVWILWTVLSKGLQPVLHVNWWEKDQSGAGAPAFDHNLRGARHAIVGTLLMGLATAVIAVPIAVLTAIYLVEYGSSPFARIVSFMVDIMSGIPSIVAALFVYAVWVTTFHWTLLPIASSLALTMLMIPVVTRSTEEMLKLVPNELREASYALGVPKWKTILRIVLPSCLSGVITGGLLGLARVMGETAPLLLLASYTQYLNQNLFHGSMAALPTMINDQALNINVHIAEQRVWGAACTLILLVLGINLLGRLIGHFTKVKR
ncbi:phosphate ABC transporter permease PstA [Flexivirga caeni]|uniref:Phosphate transport system permease protein PstA n=1 Tax=Flexivirga caeni TaxID=2294115 RepID=A0A3M9MF68_9MICO|nr:phosphate ABC transporter permease PstA [Flexivirga caeni]RNI23787.1 phosphate ABC transporter permease PstA [Flexivirga caeni]